MGLLPIPLNLGPVMKTIYLDYSNSTPVAASVRDSMLPFLNEFYGHPGSSHWFGRASYEAIEDARSNVGALLDCHPSEIVFTSGGTESVNLGLLGVAEAIGKSIENERPHLIVSELDHDCVLGCARHLAESGWELTTVPCDQNGIVTDEVVANAIRPSTRLVSIIHASHMYGTIQPIEAISELCRSKDILLHIDAAQTTGKIDCRVDELGVDLLSLSGHKFYAPKGIGALYVKTGVPIQPVFKGSPCESGVRPGTTNVPHVVGLGQAAKLVSAGLKTTQTETAAQRDRFLSQLESAIGQPVKVHGSSAPRLPNLFSIELPAVSARELEKMLPEVCFGPSLSPVRNGVPDESNEGGLNPRKCTRSATLVSRFEGLENQCLESTLQMSLGWTTSEDELQRVVQMLATAYESLRR